VQVQRRELLLYWQVAAIERTRTLARGLCDRVARAAREQKGQTPTEYLMIVGLMAAVIVLVFVTFFWGQIRAAAVTWVGRVKESVLGTKIK
jgi:Flp pilus assembly pilin Flp